MGRYIRALCAYFAVYALLISFIANEVDCKSISLRLANGGFKRIIRLRLIFLRGL